MAMTLTQDDLDAIVAAVLAGMNAAPPAVNVTQWKAGAVNDLVDGNVPANVMLWLEDPVDEVYPRVTAYMYLGAGNYVLLSDQQIRDAMMLAPTAGDPAAGSVDKHLDDLLEDTGTTLPGLIAAGGSGAGSTAYSDTVTDSSSNPLDGVEVWITSDSGGASTVASTTTDTLGAFTVYLDPGTYYLWLAKGGYNFPNPTTITVS